MIKQAARAAELLVHASIRRPVLIICSVLLLSIVAGFHAVTAFDVRTDINALLADDLPWRKDAVALEKAFPSQGDYIAVVIDADTPEKAELAAASLTSTLDKRRDLFISVKRLNGGAFFDRAALLYADPDTVKDVTSNLIAMQPLIGPVAADPSLRGLATALDTVIADPTAAQERLADLARPMQDVSDVIARVEGGRPASLSWIALADRDLKAKKDWRQFVEVLPRIDYGELSPGRPAMTAIRAAAKSLNLSPDNGVQVRISGSVAIAEDELATLGETTGPVGIAMFVCVCVLLLIGVRSIAAVAAILATVAAGAAISSSIGLLIFNRFNLVSVAFIPLFVGLSVDFGIQYCVRARADREGAIAPALSSAASAIGPALVVAAAAIAAAFFAFLPTGYQGVAELGLIAGIGILVALALTLTFLPALLSVLKAPSAGKEKTVAAFAALNRVVIAGRWPIFALSLVAILASLLVLPQLKFNFDPMRLRDAKTESVATYLELVSDPETTPMTLNIMKPDLKSAVAAAAKVRDLPQTADTITLADALPAHQDENLVAIADAQAILDPALNPFFTAPAPSDEETVAALTQAAGKLHALAEAAKAPAKGAVARKLAAQLETLATGPEEKRTRANEALLGALPVALARISTALTAEPVSLDTLPEDIRHEWVAPDGRARIQVAPPRPFRSLEETTAFVDAVRKLEPTANGDAVTIVEAGRTIRTAFLQAGALSALTIIGLLFLFLRSALWTALAVAPVLLSGLLTFATCAVTGLDINLENMIALPLMLAIGVALNIYFVIARANGETEVLRTSLAQGVLLSALTTGTAFAALMLSSHPGTASMGELLMISLFWIVVCTLVVLPAIFALVSPTEAAPAEPAPAAA